MVENVILQQDITEEKLHQMHNGFIEMDQVQNVP